MKSILIVAFNNLTHDGRVLRQIDFVKREYSTTVVCDGAPSIEGVEVIVIKRPRLTALRKITLAGVLLLGLNRLACKLQYGNREVEENLKRRNFDLIIANDAETLPLAFLVRNHAKVLFDAHEFSPRQFEEKLWWRIFFQRFNTWLCDTYVPKVNGMTTIGNGLVNAYKSEYSVDPVIITNANFYHPGIQPSETTWPIKIIHHGGATPSRRLELLVKMMTYLGDRFTLDLMLLTPATANQATKSYLDYIKGLSAGNPNIRFVPPKKPFEIVDFIQQYDIGIILVPPVNYNYENGLPNKLFDYIQARLAVAVGPLADIARVATDFDIGVVSDEFTAESMASKLKALSIDDIRRYKANADVAARALNAEKNKETLHKLINELLS